MLMPIIEKKLKRNKNRKGIKQFYALWFHWVVTPCITMLQNEAAVFLCYIGYDSSPIYSVLNGRDETPVA